jgi:hypothetical protein
LGAELVGVEVPQETMPSIIGTARSRSFFIKRFPFFSVGKILKKALSRISEEE